MDLDVSDTPGCCLVSEQLFVSTKNWRPACLASHEEDCADMVGTQPGVGNVDFFSFLGKKGKVRF